MGLGVRRSVFQWRKVLLLLFPRTSFKRKWNCQVHLRRTSVPLETSFEQQSLTPCKSRGDLVKLRKCLNGGQSPGFDAISRELSSSRIKSWAGRTSWRQGGPWQPLGNQPLVQVSLFLAVRDQGILPESPPVWLPACGFVVHGAPKAYRQQSQGRA